MLARAGAPVVMIGRSSFVEKVRSTGVVLDTLSFRETVAVEAATELSAARGADVVLFCVKTPDTSVVARELAEFVGPDALTVSLQNGVDNAALIRAAGIREVISAVVYVAASVPESGYVKHVGRGDLIVGPPGEKSERVAQLFERAGVGCRISDNIEGELWKKLVWNCALNAISALGRARYGRVAASGDARELLKNIVDEVMAVARAAGIVMPGVVDSGAGFVGAMKIATDMEGAFSSTAQDIQRGKRTEIDSLNGYIARRGAELGVGTPVNHALFTLVKLFEEG